MSWFSRKSATEQQHSEASPPTSAPPGEPLREVVATLSQRCRPSEAELRYLPADDQAQMLLDWLQAPDGRTGWFFADELMATYVEMACEAGIVPHDWRAIGRELRRLLGQRKTVGGRARRRIWYIPAAKLALATVDGQPVSKRADGV